MIEQPVVDDRAIVDYYRDEVGANVLATANRFGISKFEASALLHRAGVMRPAGVNGATKPAGVYAISGGRPLRAARLAVPLSQDELASCVGTVQATISGLETRYGYGVSDALANGLAVALSCSFGELFTTVRPASELLGSHSESSAGRVKRAEVRAAEAYAAANAWWTTRKSAEYIGVDEGTLLHNYYGGQGYVSPAEEKFFGTLPFHFWDPKEIRLFARERWASDDPRIAANRDPDTAYRLVLARTGSKKAAETARKRASGREGKRKQVVAGRANAAKGGRVGGRVDGRKRGPKPKTTTEQAEQIRQLKRQGHTCRYIAKIVLGDERLKDRVARAS
jgi:transcriptional regulator with XRE-family HTH domain